MSAGGLAADQVSQGGAERTDRRSPRRPLNRPPCAHRTPRGTESPAVAYNQVFVRSRPFPSRLDDLCLQSPLGRVAVLSDARHSPAAPTRHSSAQSSATRYRRIENPSSKRRHTELHGAKPWPRATGFAPRVQGSPTSSADISAPQFATPAPAYIRVQNVHCSSLPPAWPKSQMRPHVLRAPADQAYRSPPHQVCYHCGSQRVRRRHSRGNPTRGLLARPNQHTDRSTDVAGSEAQEFRVGWAMHDGSGEEGDGGTDGRLQ